MVSGFVRNGCPESPEYAPTIQKIKGFGDPLPAGGFGKERLRTGRDRLGLELQPPCAGELLREEYRAIVVDPGHPGPRYGSTFRIFHRGPDDNVLLQRDFHFRRIAVFGHNDL